MTRDTHMEPDRDRKPSGNHRLQGFIQNSGLCVPGMAQLEAPRERQWASNYVSS